MKRAPRTDRDSRKLQLITDEKEVSVKLELIQCFFFFFLSIQKAVFHNLFYIENGIYMIHWAKWKSLLMAGKLVKMLCNKIPKVA